MKSKFFLKVCPLVVCIATMVSVRADNLISPDNPCFNYYGRFDMSNPKAPKFNWSGVMIEASIPGPIVGMSMNGGQADYDIEIDGKIDKVIRTQSGVQKYMFRTDLTSDMHTVRIIQRNENHWGTATFGGLYLDDGKMPGAAPKKPQRKIEFLGDSHTAGYGIESTNRTCDPNQLRQYTNVNTTFASFVTRAFHAQSSILAWSGQGMVRNHSDRNKRSNSPYQFYYDRTLGAASTAAWDYSQWKADVVVINLGTNDYSTQPNPDDSMYIGDYHKLIKRVLTNYPDAAIFCVAASKGSIENNIKQIVNEETTTLGHPKVYSVSYPSSLQLSACDWHPSITDNRNIANILIDTIMEKMNWDTTEQVETKSFKVKDMSQTKLFRVTFSGNRLIVNQSRPLRQQTELSLIKLNGKMLCKKKTDINGNCAFELTNLNSGIYLIGNSSIRWTPVVIKK